MAKLKLGPIADDKPVKVTVELPAPLHRDLSRYAEILAATRVSRQLILCA
ncbi:msr6956 [Mesorhizobium japonicum MAFF 303099]|uniref:Msr6956 protein n=1 Tax=Mesorhizobium japonicum (strain LMG 29417 / CECT 9101 / MAFF 303099) TaxID=266835 RepID=Q987Q8_RHILO|nr:msr6956 [Mesorhizobium japonicum MAFF 303099]